MSSRRATQGEATATTARTASIAERLRLANELLRAGRRIEAEAQYHHVLLYQPANAQALHALAFLSLEAGELQRARDYSEAAAAAAPDDARLQAALGRVLRAQGDHGGAIRRYDAALRLDPKYADGWILLGVALRE